LLSPRAGSTLRLVLIVVAGGLLGGFTLAYLAAGAGPRDAITYLAAAERLASGGQLYSIAVGDRPIDPLSAVSAGPLLYPPLIAVLWLPLTIVPGQAALAIWWAATVVASVGLIVALLRRRAATTAVALILLVVPLTYLLTVGNVDAFILLAAVVVWLLCRRGAAAPAGAIVGVLVVVKITTVILGVWILAVAPRRGSVGLIAGLAAGLVIGLVGAGLTAHLDYIDVVRALSAEPGGVMSIATILRATGVEPSAAIALHGIVVAAGLFVVVLLRDRPGLSFALAIVLLAVGTPVVNIGSPSLLLAALAPIAWPWPDLAESAAVNVDPLPLVADTPDSREAVARS
jgi:hypothetical protein